MPERIDLFTTLMLTCCLPLPTHRTLPYYVLLRFGEGSNNILGVAFNLHRYIITYDLSAPGRNYDDLYKRIKDYPKWAHITESTWAIKTTWNASQVRDDLKQALDSNDKLLVIVTGGNWASWGLTKRINDWLNS